MSELENLISACEECGFDYRMIYERCWNDAYMLGRSRWWWGDPELVDGNHTVCYWRKEQMIGDRS